MAGKSRIIDLLDKARPKGLVKRYPESAALEEAALGSRVYSPICYSRPHASRNVLAPDRTAAAAIQYLRFDLRAMIQRVVRSGSAKGEGS